jgi:hypothetical protein
MEKQKKRLVICQGCKKRITNYEETGRMLENDNKCDKCSGYAEQHPKGNNNQTIEPPPTQNVNENAVKFEPERAVGRPK